MENIYIEKKEKKKRFISISLMFSWYYTLIKYKQMKIWKIATRWSNNGNANSSIIDIFRNNNAFEEISKLYAKIDHKNKVLNLKISISEILGIYQYLLISKYNLPDVLYKYATSTFYDRLFDTIFNTNTWKNFSNTKEIDLSISEINQIIDVRYQWEEMNYPTVEDACSVSFIRWSRYSKYQLLIYLFMYKYKSENNSNDKLFLFIRQLSKLYNIYSIRFQKAINEMHRFNYLLIDTMNTKSVDETMALINKNIGTSASHNQGWYDLNWFIANNLTHNNKRKNIICRLSAMLDEDIRCTGQTSQIRDKLFSWEIDIEHIQSFKDENIEEREIIKEEWGNELNSLGNLMVLESHINRSISNKPYDFKSNEYKKSSYKIARDQAEKYPVWNLKQSNKRKAAELDKLNRYLFGS